MSHSLVKPRITKVTTVAQSRLFAIEALDLQFSNGVERTYERIKSSGREAVMIVPIIDGKLVLIQEYGAAVESYELGFPKGLIDDGESVIDAANRELQEEVGFGARRFVPLTKLVAAPSIHASQMNIVLAEDLYAQKREGDEPEPLIVHYWPLAEAMRLLERHDFRDARSVSALFIAREWLRKQGGVSG